MGDETSFLAREREYRNVKDCLGINYNSENKYFPMVVFIGDKGKGKELLVNFVKGKILMPILESQHRNRSFICYYHFGHDLRKDLQNDSYY